MTFLKMQIEALRSRGYSNIYILDNNSTYPPLLEYYKKVPAKVVFLGKNLGYDALAKIPLYYQVRKSFFVYTDSDVIPIDECPADFMDYFLNILKANPTVQKVGFSLKIDDLPDHFAQKEKVIKWEAQFWKERIADNFIAPIDTTFALHRPYALLSTIGPYKNIRTSFPYVARHLPWYNDSQQLSEEEQFYIDSVEIGTHWSNQTQIVKNNRLSQFLSYLK